MKKYEIASINYATDTISSDYIGTDKPAADAAFEHACDIAEIRTRHIGWRVIEPIEVGEFEYKECDSDSGTAIQFRCFKDHYYERKVK